MTPTFSWAPVAGADLYVVDVYLDRDATTVYREYVSQTGTITPPDQFQDAQPGKPYFWRIDATTCGGAGVSCTTPAAASQGCPAPGSTTGTTPSPSPTPSSTPAPTPSATGVKVTPAGPEGDQSMQGGTTGSITITGANISPGACVIASSGIVTSVPTVATNSLTFNYYAPVPGGSVTFKVENADGQVSNDTTAIAVDSSAHSLALSAISEFQKRSGPITLNSPAQNATEGVSTFTFDWDDYVASGSQGTYDPKNYELEVSTTKDFDTPVLAVKDIDLTQYTDPTGRLQDGHYFWRVNGIDQSGNELTWSATQQFTVNANGPTVRITTGNGHGLLHPLVIEFSDIVKGVNSRTLRVVPDGYPVSAAVRGKITLGPTPTRFVFTPATPFATGGQYDLAVRSGLADANGNPVVVDGSPVRMRTTAKNHSRGWHYSRGWTRHAASGTVSGSYMQAGPGRTARLTVAGNQVQLAGCKGPHMGRISVTVGGKTQQVSEHQSYTRCGIVLWHRTLPAGQSRLTIKVTGRHGNFDAVRTT
jgi:hypothetical protein